MPRYGSLLELLRDDGRTFKDQMAEVESSTIEDILGRSMPKRAVQPFAEHYFTMVGSQEGAVIVCDTLHHHSQGNPGLVEFDWNEVWQRHLTYGDVIGWFHTHPPGAHGMSQTDRDTFHSWLVALGGPRWAVIQCDGRTHCWRLTLNERFQLQWEDRDAEVLSNGRILIRDER